jgi:orotate phosphoribosyltransferase
MANVAEEIAELLLRVGAVSINSKEPFVYTSGIKSPIYCDNRLIISYPEERQAITGQLLTAASEQIGLENIDVIAGTATAGIPWAAWLAEAMNKPMIYVRSGEKVHGRGQKIEGKLAPGQRVVVVEDLITTGGSSLATVNSIRENLGVAVFCLAIFSYQTGKASRNFSAAGVDLIPLTTISVLLRFAEENGYITGDDKTAVVDWMSTVMDATD